MTFYLSGAGVYGIFLLYRMFSDSECSKTDRASWMVIAIASLFWVIVIPISILEIQSKAKAKAKLDSIAKPLNFGAEARHIKTIQQVAEEPKENNSPQLNPGNS
jgi:hypothetical protein